MTEKEDLSSVKKKDIPGASKGVQEQHAKYIDTRSNDHPSSGFQWILLLGYPRHLLTHTFLTKAFILLGCWSWGMDEASRGFVSKIVQAMLAGSAPHWKADCCLALQMRELKRERMNVISNNARELDPERTLYVSHFF